MTSTDTRLTLCECDMLRLLFYHIDMIWLKKIIVSEIAI